ncbi:MAG: DnaJ domain-containing protein, partial [Kiloniellales bacterium]
EGRFGGRQLSELSLQDLLALLAECQAEDAQSLAILETYLDRVHGDAWREAAAGGGDQAGKTSAMTRNEAYEILGLEKGADEAQIREAHRRLLQKIHPDHGGSNYLAAKINQAKDLLLGD